MVNETIRSVIAQFGKLREQFRKKSILEQVVLFSFVIGFVIYGGTKPDNSPAPRMRARAADVVQNVPGGVFSLAELSTNQLNVGVALTEVRTNEVHDFSRPADAVEHIPWRRRGRSLSLPSAQNEIPRFF